VNLKPMDIGEILDKTFKLYKNNFKTYLTISALGILPGFILAVLIFITLYILGANDSANDSTLIAIVAIGLLGIIPVVMVSIASTGAIVKVVSKQLLEEKLNYQEAFKFGFKKMWPIFGAAILLFVAAFVGTIFLIIPGIFLYYIFLLYAQAIIIEDKGAFQSLSRSKGLIKGNWWRTFGISIVMTILIGFLANIVSIPAQIAFPLLLGEDIGIFIGYIVSFGISMILAPLTQIARTLLYFDLRIRKEGYDIQVMTEKLEQVNANPIQE
jgi:hypothetical protein